MTLDIHAIVCAVWVSLSGLGCSSPSRSDPPARGGEAASPVVQPPGTEATREAQSFSVPWNSTSAPADDPVLAELYGLLAVARSAGKARDLATARARIAEAIDKALVELVDREDGPACAVLERLGGFAQVAGELHEAEKARRRVLEVLSKVVSDDHLDLQTARWNLAHTLYTLGDLQGARALFEKVLVVYTRALPDEHPDLMSVRGNLAATMVKLGDLQGARVLEEQVLEVYSRTFPDDHPHVQRARGNLADTIKQLGDFEGARKLEEKVLEVYSRTFPDDHPNLRLVRRSLADTISRLGDLQGARELQEQVLEVCSRTLPGDDPELQAARGNLANTIRQLGDLHRARALQEEVIEVYSRTLSDDHSDLQAARANLAITIGQLGDLYGARALQERVLEVRTKTLPDDHAHLQLARTSLAVTIAQLGDLQGARALLEKVLEVDSRTLRDDHPHLQFARGNLAATIAQLGDLQGARELQDKVLEVRSKSLPDDHPDLQTAREGLAVTICQLGDLQGARSLQEKVLEVRSKSLHEDHPHLQTARGNLAFTLYALGDLEGARRLEERALEVYSRTLQDEHPDLQRERANLAKTLAAESALGRREKEEGRRTCARLIQDLCRGQIHAVREVLLLSPGREAEERSARLASVFGIALSFARGYGVFAPSHELEVPSFLLSESARGAAIASAGVMRRAAGSPEYAERRRALVEATDELSSLARKGGTSETFDAARVKREKAERELMDLARRVSGWEFAGIELDVPTLARRLGERAVSVSYRRYKETHFDVPQASYPTQTRAAPRGISTERLCAFVVHGASADHGREGLCLVDLGPMEPIEGAVRAWREALGVDGVGRGVGLGSPAIGPERIEESGRELRRLVFDPLRDCTVGVEHMIVLYDDLLHLVPLDALPAEEESAGGETKRIGDRLRIETRTTLSELFEEDREPRGEVLVAVGGASFDMEPLPPTDAGEEKRDAGGVEENGTEIAAVLRGGAFENGFEPLAHSSDEARGIGALYEQTFGGSRPASVLEGRRASREAIVELAPQVRFLHIATHGWFAADSIRSWSDARPLDEKTGLGVRLSGEAQVRGLSPMLLCGLALAGANLPENELGRAPGLVTAEEIATFDLSSCELAVLSACDTARGQIRRVGQGVASLQRALQIAGARSVITSLWRVPDEATKELMLDFYRRIWVEKEPKGQALWEAKKKVREARDASGRTRFATRDWAAWVLTGNPD